MAASKKTRSQTTKSNTPKDILCDQLSFAAAESYKLLRANLIFTIPAGENNVIGVTSSTRGEGKSTTSINLAYTIAEAGKKVLLIDSDMRLPSSAKRMGIQKSPGLSNAIIGQTSASECIYPSGKGPNWDIMPSGDTPPNPSELLSSNQFSRLIEKLQTKYDYIIMDLPPVNLVSDAVTVAPKIQGLIFVVRQNFSSRVAVKEAIARLDFLDAKILGFVFTDANEETSSKGLVASGANYKKYGNKYNRHYNYGKYGSYEYKK